MVELTHTGPSRRLYFLGIGGTAMGALACACKDAGFEVSGSDTGIYSPMKEFLAQRSIAFYDGYDAKNVSRFKPDQMIVGNAISRGNAELEYALDERIDLRSMPQIIHDLFIRKHLSIVVSGTHGKTTTASLAAWLLDLSALPTGFFIGAICGNFGIGCRPVPSDSAGGYFVTEGDEYDSVFYDKRSKFLSYRPDIAIINNIEFDHADIFDSLDAIKKSFALFARLVPRNGLIIANGDDANVREVCRTVLSEIETFGFGSSNTWRAVDIHFGEDSTHFTVLLRGLIYSRFSSGLSGEHNVMNQLAIIALGRRLGLTKDQTQAAIQSYIPPKRRMEEIGNYRGATVVDDFAHHPTAIRLTIKAASQKYPGRRLIACFEPRSHTSARNCFQSELASAFDDADVVVVGCINRPERYKDSDRLDRELLRQQLLGSGKQVFLVSDDACSAPAWAESIMEFFHQNLQSDDVILLLSNGNFGGLRSLLTEDSSNMTLTKSVGD